MHTGNRPARTPKPGSDIHLRELLAAYRSSSQSEREKGTLFEDLICSFFRHDPSYKNLYTKVEPFADWAKGEGKDARDTGIDLVAHTCDGEVHAVQCKFYAPDHRIAKADIDSFFTASGQGKFKHRVIVSSTNLWTEHAENSLVGQSIPVTRIDLRALEASPIDWSQFKTGEKVSRKPTKKPMPHQDTAIAKVLEGFEKEDRGQLLMACGTGKTFVSLKIAEQLCGPDKLVVFCVPSLALLSQALTEWSNESDIPIRCFAVCSDSEVGKKRSKSNDAQVQLHELHYPATTSARRLANAVAKSPSEGQMNVVFSTYHSLDVLKEAQQQHGLLEFDLVVCDEAHRTTGVTFTDEDESAFVMVHDNENIQAKKRLYMTATPRIFVDKAQKGMGKTVLDDTSSQDESTEFTLSSMNDKVKYGSPLYTLNFSDAVVKGLLSDYKVLVLAIDQSHVDQRLQSLLRQADNSLHLDDAAKIVGCWKALGKTQMHGEAKDDPDPMQRAVAFCQVIDPSTGRKAHKVSSREIAEMFKAVVEEYQKSESEHGTLVCEARHVDGTMNASVKYEHLSWLRAKPEKNECRILSNVRCLSEGVDVPALDAVLFLSPRKSQIEVVQAVGRVMRKAKGKQRGYVVLPIVIPPDITPEEALNSNKSYKVVWEVLQALRAHDDRFDAMINKLTFEGTDPSKMEVIPISGASGKRKPGGTKKPGGDTTIGVPPPSGGRQGEIVFEPGVIERAIFAKVVQKCGRRTYWEDWANDIAAIARTHIVRITNLVKGDTKEARAFKAFADELRDDLNESITNEEVVEMLAQHLITRPVFDALFEGYSFAGNNPVSQAMQRILDLLQEHRLDKESDTLESFYTSVSMRASSVLSDAGKQKIVVELYDKFFRNAFPRMTERLGIVYTPVEIVDFILNSVNHLLKEEFGQTLGSKGVHIIDPFVGTGTFITRLLQSGLISKDQLPYKYQNEIHANEIVLLAYYIAAINIESVYHSIVGGNYKPFEGICLTDTFQLYEKDDLVSKLLVDNSGRRKRQKELDIRVIIGNPPYSVGQRSANDNNANVSYPSLDRRIEESYADNTTAINVKALYDSYIRALRWASDRIGESGMIGFVSNAGFLDSNSASGLRKCLVDEFSSVYVFNLRGNARTSGEQRRKEKDNVFGQGTRTPIAISLLVKNPRAKQNGKIYYHDIGDYLSQEEKLEKIRTIKSVAGITDRKGWQDIRSDQHGDWLNQRVTSFEQFIVLGDKRSDHEYIFENYSLGVATNRDVWCYNSGRVNLENNMRNMISFYNNQLSDFNQKYSELDQRARARHVSSFIDNDLTKIKWSRSLMDTLVKAKHLDFDQNAIRQCLYRPFNKQWMYFDRDLNEIVYQMPKLFPQVNSENLVICVTGRGGEKEFSTLICNSLLDLHTLKDGAQSFPLFLYDNSSNEQIQGGGSANLFGDHVRGVSSTRKYGITGAALAKFQDSYSSEEICLIAR